MTRLYYPLIDGPFHEFSLLSYPLAPHHLCQLGNRILSCLI